MFSMRFSEMLSTDKEMANERYNMNALSGILLQRVLSALGSTEIQIGNFGDVIAINKIFMLKAQREYGKAEALSGHPEDCLRRNLSKHCQQRNVYKGCKAVPRNREPAGSILTQHKALGIFRCFLLAKKHRVSNSTYELISNTREELNE